MTRLTENQLEYINFLMKVMIMTTTIFFFLAFIVIFFGLFGVPRQTSQDTIIILSPVIGLLVMFTIIFNFTHYRCPVCRTFIRRDASCPVCTAIEQVKKKSGEVASFLLEEDAEAGVTSEIEPEESKIHDSEILE